MKGFTPLVLGMFGTFAFSWVGLILIPNFQIGHLDPQADEEGTDIYPMPASGMVDRGREIYAANGCVYCHTEQVRADYAASDIDRKWGDRRSAPRDYLFQHPVLLGKVRMGPDLTNLGKRAPAETEAAVQPSPSAAVSPAGGAAPPPAGSPTANANRSAAAPVPPGGPTNPPPAAPASPSPGNILPSPAGSASQPAASQPAAPPTGPSQSTEGPAKYSEAWHHQHLYAPRSLSIDSNMPAFGFLYEKRLIGGQVSADALKLTGSDAPPEGWEIVPTYDARCLVAYLMSLDQSHPLKDAKPATPVASPGAAPQSSPAASAPAGKGTK